MEWARYAQAVIDDKVEGLIACTKDLGFILREIDAAYPFGERRYWPYKAWLTARRNTLAVLRCGPPIYRRAGDPTLRDDRTTEMFA